jgi:hypothetical protein
MEESISTDLSVALKFAFSSDLKGLLKDELLNLQTMNKYLAFRQRAVTSIAVSDQTIDRLSIDFDWATDLCKFSLHFDLGQDFSLSGVTGPEILNFGAVTASRHVRKLHLAIFAGYYYMPNVFRSPLHRVGNRPGPDHYSIAFLNSRHEYGSPGFCYSRPIFDQLSNSLFRVSLLPSDPDTGVYATAVHGPSTQYLK